MSSDFFHKYVATAYEDWRRKPSDLRFSKILAAELNNLAEHYWKLNHQTSPAEVGLTSSPTKYRDYLATVLPDFGLIRDVADSHKHLFLDRASAKVKLITMSWLKLLDWGRPLDCALGEEIS